MLLRRDRRVWFDRSRWPLQPRQCGYGVVASEGLIRSKHWTSTPIPLRDFS
jgi:hypothetical protein